MRIFVRSPRNPGCEVFHRVFMFPKTLILLLIILIACSTLLVGQNAPRQPAQQPTGGVSTGTPLNYTTKRTAGVTDPKAPIIFEDVTDKTAMANFKHRSGSPDKNYIFEVASGSVAIFDYEIGRASCRE